MTAFPETHVPVRQSGQTTGGFGSLLLVSLFILFCLGQLTSLSIDRPEHLSNIFSAEPATSAANKVFFLTALACSLILTRLDVFRRVTAANMLIVVAVIVMAIPSLGSDAASVTIRRAGFSVTVILTVFAFFAAFEEPLAALKAFAISCAVLLLLDYFSVLFLGGVHVIEQAGAWRGVYAHKNIAGATAALSAILFLFLARNDIGMRTVWLLLSVAALLFLWRSESRTAAAVFLPSLFLAAVTSRLLRSHGPARFAARLLIVLVFLGSATVPWWAPPVAQSFGVDSTFTGRTALWSLVIHVSHLKPWFGWGYGNFFHPFAGSPFFGLAGNDFLRSTGQAHNGYLDIVAQGGYVAMTIASLALLVPPMRISWVRNTSLSTVTALLSIWYFVVLRNGFEADFFNPLRPPWLFMLVSLVLMTLIARQDAEDAQ